MKTVNVRTKYKIVGSDYSGQELRLATFLSQDPILLKSYAEDKDVYAMIASMIFDTSYENCLEFYPEGTEIEIDGKKVITGYKTHKNAKGKERRSVGKTCVLAGNYGMGPAGAGSLMGKTAKEGEEILNKYFSMFKGLKSAIDKSKEILKKQGYVEDIIGRRRRLPDISLKPYEVISMNKSLVEDSFNPIIGCKNREIKDPKVTYWENKIAQEITKSHSNQLSTKKYDELVQTAKKDNILIQSNTGKIAQAERQCFNASIQGCLSYNELIYTKEGLNKIGDLVNKKIAIWDGTDWSSAYVVASGKKQKCILTTNLGEKIICSPDHKFLVCNTYGTEKFKKFSELTKNDRLIVEQNYPKINNEVSFRKLIPNITKAVNTHDYSFDDISNYYIRGQILGRIASDGSYGLKKDGGSYIYLLVAEHELELLDFFKKNLPYKYSISTKQKKNQKIYRLCITSKSLWNECNVLDIKHNIPDCFFKNTDLLRGFISGFFDGDGTANNDHVVLDFGIQADFTNIINKFKIALNLFGINNTVTKYKDRFRVTIRKYAIKLFAERIGFITRIKQQKASNISTSYTNKTFNNKYTRNIKSLEITNDFINMYDVCDTNKGYFIINGIITHNSAGTLTKKAMIDIFNDQELKKYDTHLILTVHDEVLVECKSFYADNVLKRLPEIMINAAQELGITAPKMKCDPYIVDRWYADEAAVSLQKEYKDFEKDGLSAPEALEKLCNDHIEFPRESIINVINGTTEDLEF